MKCLAAIFTAEERLGEKEISTKEMVDRPGDRPGIPHPSPATFTQIKHGGSANNHELQT